MTRRRLVDVAIALGLFAGYLALLLRGLEGLGYARDEGFYFQAASSYEQWFKLLFTSPSAAMQRAAVDGAWAANHEHPALVKSLFALSHLFLHEKHRVFAMEGTSYRFPGMVLASGGVALTYLWGARAKGRTAGVAAAILLALMPRFFFQAHLACFDAAVVTMWMLCAYTWWRAMSEGGALWPVLTGVTFGLALDTKHNAWFLPFLALAHAAFVAVALRLDPRTRDRAWGSLRRAGAALAAMATLGPLVFWTLWPWLWHDTRARLGAYASFHLNHEYYNMEFFGRTYWQPPMPRLYAPVMTLATVPTITLVLFAIGAGLALRSRLLPPIARLLRRATPASSIDVAETPILWVGAVLVSYGAWLSPKTPIFGGTKHWMTAYPFIALLGGWALAAVVSVARRALTARRLRRFARGPVLDAALGAMVLAAPAVETVRSHPWGLSAYVPLAGGASGAATLGLNRGFWGYTTGAVADYLDALPRGASVYPHDTAPQSWSMLVADRRIRRDLRAVWSTVDADVTLYHHEQHMEGQEYQAWVAYGTVRPDHLAGLDGVPVIWVYRRP